MVGTTFQLCVSRDYSQTNLGFRMTLWKKLTRKPGSIARNAKVSREVDPWIVQQGGQKATSLVCKYVYRRCAREIVRDVESNRGTVDHIGRNEESRGSSR